jgi:hypothetical protein
MSGAFDYLAQVTKRVLRVLAEAIRGSVRALHVTLVADARDASVRRVVEADAKTLFFAFKPFARFHDFKGICVDRIHVSAIFKFDFLHAGYEAMTLKIAGVDSSSPNQYAVARSAFRHGKEFLNQITHTESAS